MSKRYDVAAPRQYKDREGNEKTAWTNLGVAWEKDGKISVSLHALPLTGPDGTARVILMEPRPNDRQQGNGQSQQRNEQSNNRGGGFPDDLDDNVPF